MTYPLKHDYVATNDPWTQTRADDSANLINSIYANWSKILTPTAVKTSAYTAAAFEWVVCDSTAGAFAIALPTSPTDKTLVGIVKINSGVNAVTVNRGGTNRFYIITTGPTSVVIVGEVESRIFQYQSSTGLWHGVGGNVPLAATDARYVMMSSNTALVTVKDVNLVIQDDSDVTKQAKFQCSGITTATTRTYTLPDASTTVVGTDVPQTLTGKRVLARLGVVTPSATPTINIDGASDFYLFALATNITSMTTNLTGTPTDGEPLTLRFQDTGTGRTITWGAKFVAAGGALLSTTIAGKTHIAQFIYDGTAAKWACTNSDATGY